MLLQYAAGLQVAYSQSSDSTDRVNNELIIEERIKIWKQWADLGEEELFLAYINTTDTWLRNHVPSIMPLRVEDGNIRLTSHFGPRIHPITKESKFHSGIDLAAANGQLVYATAQGLVERTGRDAFLGNFIVLSHAGQFETWYGHLSEIGVEPGQLINRGDIIGRVGSTGRSTSYHLHYTVKRLGKAVDADRYLFLRYGLLN